VVQERTTEEKVAFLLGNAQAVDDEILSLLRDKAVGIACEVLQFALRSQPKFRNLPTSSRAFSSGRGRPVTEHMKVKIKGFGARADRLIDARNSTAHFDDSGGLTKAATALLMRLLRQAEQVRTLSREDEIFGTAVAVLRHIRDFEIFFL
jgi:hypothetical protein